MKRICCLLICCLLAALPASAQEFEVTPEITVQVTDEPTATLEPTLTPTPAPTTVFEGVGDGFVFKWSVDAIFPEGIRFMIALQRSAEQIERLTLTIRPEGGTPITVDVPLDEPVAQGNNFVDVAYLWEFTPSNRARVFGRVEYEWLAVDSVGDRARVEDGLIFSDERVLWTTHLDPQEQLDFTLPIGGLSDRAVRATVADVYALLAANTNRPDERLNIVLYNKDVPASNCTATAEGQLVAVSAKSDANLPCELTSADAIYTASGYDLVQSGGTNLNSAQSALVADLVEHFYAPVWAGMPAWFQYGLTQFYHPVSKQPFYGPVRNAARVDELLPMSVMNTADASELWRAQSYAMVLYIADRLGVDGLYALANSASLAEGYQAAVGESIDGLIPGVQRWIFTDAANSSFNLTAYQDATPTPSATPSRTPTGTATSTPTETLIPSETPTPTLTRTRTPPTLTPSTTPRPASSLFTPTPTPEPSPLAGLSDPGTQSGILSILLIALVIVVLLYVIVSRRENRNW